MGEGGGAGEAGAPGVLQGWLTEQAGRDRVANGLVHPYFGAVGRAFLGSWNADRAIARRGFLRQLQFSFSKRRVALVRVTQGPDGRLRSVELVSPSNDAEVDRAAVEGVRAAATGLPPPPAEVGAGRPALVSLWEFELEISVMPPVPVIGLTFDEVRGVIDVRLPLDRRIWKRVRLVAMM